LVTSPRLHKHRYCGVLAPNAALRAAVTASAGPAGATLQLLDQARARMGLPTAEPAEPDAPSPLANLRRAAARCWALLLVRIYECLSLRCPKCGEPMRVIAFVLDRPTVERILEHIGEPTRPPAVSSDWAEQPITRDTRQRYLPTEYGHAARNRCAGGAREYQSDASSKRPASSAFPARRDLEPTRKGPPP